VIIHPAREGAEVGATDRERLEHVAAQDRFRFGGGDGDHSVGDGPLASERVSGGVDRRDVARVERP